MGKLGKKERDFCLAHGIPLERLFDASGIRAKDFCEIMKADEKWAAYGVTPCRAYGHVLRNRHNTCLMCDTERVGHLLHRKMAGYLYVASGAGGGLMKLGFSTNPANRIYIANCEFWGGHRDWVLRAYAWAHEAGRLESELHAEFAALHVPLEWHRNWKTFTTREAYRADITAACEKLVWLCDGYPEIVPPPWN